MHFSVGSDTGTATVDADGHLHGTITVGGSESLGSNPILVTLGSTTVSVPFTVVPVDSFTGRCTGQVALGTISPALTDATQVGVTVKARLLQDLSAHTLLAGSCSAPVRKGDPIHPAGGPLTTLTPKSTALSVSGNASCASAADDPNAAAAWPLNGKITWTMRELDDRGKAYQIQAAISIAGSDEAAPDVVDVQGIVLKGPGVGALVGGTVWEDPVSKTGGGTGYNTGYELDLANATGCSDATPGNATISTIMLGGGGASSTSLLGSTATGITFTLGE
jgi:hypothetical protein